MSQFKEISTKELNANPFQLIGKDWMLITAKKDNKINTMTASWGGLGVLWNKDVAYVVIRPQRYTKEFIDASTTFSLSFFDDSHKSSLTYCGRVSGREEDKIAKSGLTVCMPEDTPYFAEAKTVLVCKKLFAQPLSEASFLDSSILDACYPNKDYHIMYIAEIQKVLVAD